MDWETLEKECLACTRCALHETRHNVVFGVGRRDADICFIGEGPGEQEDLQGEPFVGRAGKLLDEMLAVIGLTRTDVYIANIVKCRPPGNRDPMHLEQEACLDFLRAQMKLVAPKIIVCLGRVAAQRMISETFKITQERGVWTQKGAFWMMATYHPAYLLRDPRKKPDAFDDLLSLERKMKELG